MDAKGLVVQPGQGSVWNMSPGRSAALKLQNADTAESVMAFEETAPAGTDTGAEPGRALFLYTPGRAGRMFEEARRLQRPLSSMDDGEVAEFFKRFGWETVGPPPF